MFLFLEFDYFNKTFLNEMEFSNKLKKLKSDDENQNIASIWALDDDCSQASLSTTSLSIDIDEFKYMDEDSDSSSSDEIYSLETSLIEMNDPEDPCSTDNRTTYKQNWSFQHQATPMVGRSINFYDNDNFIDDTLSQLANKGFAQSLSRQTFVQKHSYQQDDNHFDGLLLSQLKDNRWLDNFSNNSNDPVAMTRKTITNDSLLEHSFDMDLMDNEDLLSISSHGSDRSTTPVDSVIVVPNESEKHCQDSDKKEDTNVLNCGTMHDHKRIHPIKPNLLRFTDMEDIELFSPGKHSRNNDVDEDDSSTICGDHWQDYQDIEWYKETLYHQQPKSADRSAAQRLARRLFDLDGFKLNDVSKHLSKRNDFNQMVGEEFANFFEFSNQTLDSALRKFLEKFILCGDTQERERVIHHFSRRYVQCNSSAYGSEEACHTLVCALMLLNTDLHANMMNRKMSCDDFVTSMVELNNGNNFDNEELILLFNSILHNPIRWNMDNELVGLIQPKIEYADFNKQMNTSNFNFYLEVPSEATSKEYMSGYLLRKCTKESHFRRTSIGKRGWKLYFGRLQDLTLYLYKDEISLNGSMRRPSRKLTRNKKLGQNGITYSDPVLTQILPNNNNTVVDTTINGSDSKKSRPSRKFPRLGKRDSVPSPSKSESDQKTNPQPESIPSNTDLDSVGTVQIYLNHAFASKANDYSKKRNVFRLQVSGGSEYLFQVNEPREVELWVDCLNFVAALLSPPIFNSCSNNDMSDSSLKKSNQTLTTLNIKEQLESHQRCVLTLEQDLVYLNSKPPSKSDKTKLKWQYNRQRKFIERELIRYKTYCRLLEFELIHLHNLAMARMSQQAFIDPYLIPVQYSQISGASPMFYNQQTNQFVPINCVPGNTQVFQYHPGSGGTINNSSIKELSEDTSTQMITTTTTTAAVTIQEPLVNIQPIIIRPSYSCTRTSRSQLSINKRRRYRNNSLQPQQQQQHPQPILMHYKQMYKAAPQIQVSTTLIHDNEDSNSALCPNDQSKHDSLTPSNKTILQSLPIIEPLLPPANGTTTSVTSTFYEIL